MDNEQFQNTVLQALARLQQDSAQFQMFIVNQFDKLDTKVTILDKKFTVLERRINSLEQRFDSMEQGLRSLDHRFDLYEQNITNINLIIENEIQPSIKLLAESQYQMKQQLDRTEENVSLHDEFILKRIK